MFNDAQWWKSAIQGTYPKSLWLLLYNTMDKRLAMEGNIYSTWQQDTQLTIEDAIPIFDQHGIRIKLYCGRQKRRDRWNICSRWHRNDREMEVWINFSGRRVTSWEGTGGTYIPDGSLMTGRWRRCGSTFLKGEWLHYYTMQQGHKQIPSWPWKRIWRSRASYEGPCFVRLA